jgi:hypothetical protein
MRMNSIRKNNGSFCWSQNSEPEASAFVERFSASLSYPKIKESILQVM